jgi:putative ABC transport system permease protein
VASALTAFTMALGVLMFVAVLLTLGVVSESFQGNSSLGYHMVVGKKGGRLELILHTVFYLGRPIENIPYDYYLNFLDADEVRDELEPQQLDELLQVRRRRLTAREREELDQLDPAQQEERLLTGEFAAQTELAIPIAMGDYFREYRVVGTSPKLFDELVYREEGDRKYKYKVAHGENFQSHSDEHGYFEAVAGATVARRERLKLGDKIVPTHSSTEEEGGKPHVHDPFRIVGILAPSGTPNDRAVFVNIEGFLLMEGHDKPDDEIADEYRADDLEEHEHVHDHDGHEDHDDPHGHEEHAGKDAGEQPEDEGHDHGEGAHQCDSHCEHHHGPLPLAKRELTAVLVRCTSDHAASTSSRSINKGAVAQAALPVMEITNLLVTFVHPLRWVLLSVTVMICIVSGIGILVSIYNSMSDRRHEIAVMRALGAGRSTVMTIILLESIMLAVGGGMIGWLGGHLVMGLAAPWILDFTGVTTSMFHMAPPLLNLPVSAELLLIPGLILLAIVVGLIPAVAAYRTDVAKSLGSK